jgi:hypothetical protein
LFAASIPPFSTNVGVSPTEKNVRIDLYRFVLYHLEVHPQELDEAPQHELARWSSLPVASYTQVMKFAETSEERIVLVKALAELGVVALWDSTTDCTDEAFYPIDEEAVTAAMDLLGDGGGEFTLSPNAEYKVPRDGERSSNGFTSHRRAGIATDAMDAPGARVFSPEDSDTRPGFEVKMVGPASARQVLVNVTMVAHEPNQSPILLRRMIVVSARDL